MAELRMVGDDVEVPLVTGGAVRYLNLDVAASAPCLQVARDAADALLPWYASVHRGAGYKSRVTTEAYEAARASVARFVGGRGDDVTIFTRNTTDALNLLAACLPAGTEVVAFASEHHANLLPWRRHALTLLPVPSSAADAVAAVRGALAASTADEVLLAVTGASNVTGELWPVAELAAAARAAGARTVLDAAQLAPHHPVDIAALDVDWVALSGHKLYAPYGAGALVGRADVLRTAEPYLQGGGAARFVTPDEVVWGDLPDRQEAGSPNVVGAVALAAVCEALAEVGMGTVAAHEQALVAHAEAALAAVPGIERLRLWEAGAPRIGVLAFNLAGVHHALVAAALSAEHGIGVRYGWFCAHPMMASLLGVTPEAAAGYGATLRAGGTVALPSAVRASTGLGTTTADIDRLAEALSTLATEGPAWSYRQHGDGNLFEPEPDPRPALAAVVAARLVASGR